MSGPFKRIRLSIVTRILLASILPLLFIFSMVIVNINRVIYDDNKEFARERTVFNTRQAAARTEILLQNISFLLAITSADIALVLENGSPDAKAIIDGFVQSLMDVKGNVYCAWLKLEPGTLHPDQRYDLSLIRGENGVHGIAPASDELLADEELTSWYNLPRKTGKPVFVTVDHYDFGVGKGKEYTGSFGYPIILGGKTVGVIGADILYQDTFNFIDDWEADARQHVLVAADSGLILYSTDPAFNHKNISDIPFPAGSMQKLEAGLAEGKPVMFETLSPGNGEQSLFHLAPLELVDARGGLFLLVDIPLSALYHKAEKATRMVAATSILGLFLLAASVFFAVRTLVKPIKKITASADLIASGKLDVRLDGFAPDKEPRHEVDQLGLALGQMLEQLNQAHALKLYAIEAEYEKKRIEQDAEAKGRFFANMSHEIRTPMNAILGMSELLLACDLAAKEKKYAGDIKAASETLLRIINDILDFSKLESGNFQLAENDYDLWELLDGVYSICSVLAREKNLDFDINLGKGVPHYLYGDDIRIRQVLLNIAGNAIKFTDSGFVKIDVSVNDGIMQFDIEDSGIGIKEEDQKHLFQRFRQFDSGARRKASGSGLGLSISYNLVDLMGGTIMVESIYRKGSVFRVMLPLKTGDPRKVEERGDLLSAGFSKSAKVLVVDDSEINLEVAKGLLGLFEVNADLARSGAEALEAVRKKNYDIIFMDNMMPDMDGAETTTKIRKLGGKLERQVIVALSADADAASRESLLLAGMNDFLAKPIEKGKLLAILAKWMPKERFVPAMENKLPTQDTRITERETAKRLESIANESPMMGKIRKIRELNVDLGMDMVGGEEEFYLNMLNMTYMLSESRKEKLLKHLASDDLTLFVIEIHAAKGELANIGAISLSDIASDLEKAARAGDAGYCRKNVERFFAGFDKLANNLRGVFGGHSTAIF